MRFRIPFIIFVALFSALSLGAASGVLSYVEGDVTLETSDGAQRYAEIGDLVGLGDTLYTAENAVAEISLDGGSTVTIEAGSVFNVGEVAAPEIESRKRSFFRVILGAVSFKFRNITDEPDVGTNLTVCSVRGTEFSVYSAPDGASMTVVSDGLVEVSSGGASALLPAGVGVQAVAGLGLGEPFEAKKGFVRYDQFAQEALNRIDDDPVKALEGLTAQLLEYIEEGEFYLESYKTNREEYLEVRAQSADIRDKRGDDAADEFNRKELGPLAERGFDLSATYRHHVISGLFMRRYLLSGIYVRIRTQYLQDPKNDRWSAFSNAYGELLDLYENRLIPILEEEDL